ncbi:MAG: paraquat-inducible protein A [Candidatus Sedimenticola endophacoides]
MITITRRESILLNALLLAAAVLLGTGLVAPMLTIEKFIFIRNSFSVLSGIGELFNNGQYLLFAIITTFSVLMPTLKILFLLRLVNPASGDPRRLRRHLRLMHEYGRWSMLDVFVVALVVVSVKLDAIARVQIHYGLYAFSAAVLITMLVTARVARHAESA